MATPTAASLVPSDRTLRSSRGSPRTRRCALDEGAVGRSRPSRTIPERRAKSRALPRSTQHLPPDRSRMRAERAAEHRCTRAMLRRAARVIGKSLTPPCSNASAHPASATSAGSAPRGRTAPRASHPGEAVGRTHRPLLPVSRSPSPVLGLHPTGRCSTPPCPCSSTDREDPPEDQGGGAGRPARAGNGLARIRSPTEPARTTARTPVRRSGRGCTTTITGPSSESAGPGRC